MRPLLTVKEAARLLKVHPIHIYRLVRRRSIPSLKIPGVGVRFDAEELEGWAKEGKKEVRH